MVTVNFGLGGTALGFWKYHEIPIFKLQTWGNTHGRKLPSVDVIWIKIRILDVKSTLWTSITVKNTKSCNGQEFLPPAKIPGMYIIWTYYNWQFQYPREVGWLILELKWERTKYNKITAICNWKQTNAVQSVRGKSQNKCWTIIKNQLQVWCQKCAVLHAAHQAYKATIKTYYQILSEYSWKFWCQQWNKSDWKILWRHGRHPRSSTVSISSFSPFLPSLSRRLPTITNVANQASWQYMWTIQSKNELRFGNQVPTGTQ